VVARYGVGVDAVDLAAAAARGVVVANTPGANSVAVAEHAVALLLAAVRNVVRDDRRVRDGRYTVTRAREFTGLRLGVVGLGRIGRALAHRARALGMHVLAVDPGLTAAQIRASGAEPTELAELAATCDALSLHAPGGSAVVDDALLEQVPPHLVLVNTARAALVDERAVAAALREERLACYATDDLAASSDGGSLLLADDLRDRVIVTPHSAAQTVEAVDNMGIGATEAVLAVLAGRSPAYLVPAPPQP
jgi:D-3-phosphoglycerate dehydrogenase